jgi:hypothetical protein
MAAASIFNALTRKTSINTGFGIASIHGELLLHHGGMSQSELRRRLSPLFTRYQAARWHGRTPKPTEDDPVAQLERLAKLRSDGLLTEEEFQAARARQAKRLTE